MKPAVVSKENPDIMLHALTLVITKITDFQPKYSLEPVTGLLKITYRNANMLQANNGHLFSSAKVNSGNL
jgi:hypothetical protein